MTRAALYGRVSTAEQNTLPMQLETMRDYAKQRGWEIVAEVSETQSGAKVRPERNGLISMAKRGEVDVIVVWKLDRWGRSMPDIVTTLEDLTRASVGFVSVTEGFDCTTAVGKAFVGMLAVFAQFERDQMRERTKAGLAHAKAQGKVLGRPSPHAVDYGKVVTLRSEGHSIREISTRTGISKTTVATMVKGAKEKVTR